MDQLSSVESADGMGECVVVAVASTADRRLDAGGLGPVARFGQNHVTMRSVAKLDH